MIDITLFSGMVLRVDEYVIVEESNGMEYVLCLEKFYSVAEQDYFHIICHGTKFPFIKYNGVVEKNFWTGYGHIPEESSELISVSEDKVKRKVNCV